MKWAKSLILATGESIENRLENVLKEILNELGNIPCIISLIDATGQAANTLTKRNNNGEHIQTDVKEMILLTQEDGQIFDLVSHTPTATVPPVLFPSQNIKNRQQDNGACRPHTPRTPNNPIIENISTTFRGHKAT